MALQNQMCIIEVAEMLFLPVRGKADVKRAGDINRGTGNWQDPPSRLYTDMTTSAKQPTAGRTG